MPIRKVLPTVSVTGLARLQRHRQAIDFVRDILSVADVERLDYELDREIERTNRAAFAKQVTSCRAGQV